MKKVKMFALMLLAGAAIFSSCKKDDADETGPAPTISFTNNVSSYEIDFATQADPYTVNFIVTVAAEEEIKTFTAKKKVNGTTTNITPAPTNFDGKTSYTYNYSGSFASTDTYPVELIFSCTDKADQTTEKTFTVTKKAAVVQTPFATEITTGTFYHIQGSLQGGYDLDAGAMVWSADPNGTKSMVNTDAAAATFTGSWASNAANGTMFAKITGTAYSAIYQENAATLFTGTATTVTNPTVGDVYIAKKGTSTYYVIEITALDPVDNTCGCGNKGKISFKYKK